MQPAVYQVPETKSLSVYTKVLLHVLLAIAIQILPILAAVYGILYFVYGVLKVIQTGNKNNEAAFFAVYLGCFEILIRMSRFVALYEFGKYSVALILFVGMAVEGGKRRIPLAAIIYFCLLIPSIFVGNYYNFDYFRKSVSFNLSGPFCLMISWAYFYYRRFNKPELERLVLQMILPITAVLVVILWKIPTHFNFDYEMESSKAFSGGFGPNQVSVVLGFGFFVSSLSILLGLKIFNSRFAAFVPPFLFAVFGIMTFSRGGVLTGIFSLILSVFVYIRMGRGSRQFSKLFFGMVIFAALSYFLWGIINIYTNNSVSRRYGNTLKSGKEGAGQSGSYMDRLNIATQDLKAFEAHPILGNGPEGSHQFRAKNFNTDLAAHTEFTRLLGDHGLFGLVALLILVCSPYYYYNRRKGDNKIILIGFIAISFLTMFHAAMRLAIPGLAFGLALIDVNLQDHPLERYG